MPKLKCIVALPIAAAAILVFPSIASAQTSTTASPGVVELNHELDAKKLNDGQTIQARLTDTVRLADGTRIPEGSWLTATVQKDVAQESNSSLTLRFNAARTRDGRAVPIRATILNASLEPDDLAYPSNVLYVPSKVSDRYSRIDTIGFVSGVDLHSNLKGRNSGVFIATKRRDVKVPNGTKMLLAISPVEVTTAGSPAPAPAVVTSGVGR